MNGGGEPVAWPCRLPADLSDALADVQRAMRATKSDAVRYVMQLGIESWRLRERELGRLEQLAAQGMTLEALLPFLGNRAQPIANAKVKRGE